MKKMLASYFFYVYKCAHKTLVPSSSGLGHRPLTAATRVRVSLGSPIKKCPLYEGIFLLIIVRELELAGSEFDNKREAHGVCRFAMYRERAQLQLKPFMAQSSRAGNVDQARLYNFSWFCCFARIKSGSQQKASLLGS